MHALLQKAHESGKWITLPNGTHVLVGEGGKIAEGPKNLTGKPINNLPSSPDKGSSKSATPHDQTATLAKVRKEAQHRELNDAMGGLQGVNLKSRNIPHSIGDQFDAHGTADLSSLTKLLNGGIDKSREFYSSPLSGANAEAGGYGVTVKDNSSFVVLGHPGKTIKDGGIAGVLVDPLHTPNIPDLQKAFPHVKFVAAADAAKVLPKVTGAGGKPVRYDKSAMSLRKSPGYRRKGEDRWITLEPSGTHVQIGAGGNIEKGPAALKNKPVNNLPEHKEQAKPAAKPEEKPTSKPVNNLPESAAKESPKEKPAVKTEEKETLLPSSHKTINASGVQTQVETNPSADGLKNWLKANGVDANGNTKPGKQLKGYVWKGNLYVWEGLDEAGVDVAHDDVHGGMGHLKEGYLSTEDRLEIRMKNGKVEISTSEGVDKSPETAKVGQRLGVEVKRISLRTKAKDDSGRWITLDPSGTHVHIGSGGNIDKGPAKLTNKPVNKLPKHKEEPKTRAAPPKEPSRPATNSKPKDAAADKKPESPKSGNAAVSATRRQDRTGSTDARVLENAGDWEGLPPHVIEIGKRRGFSPARTRSEYKETPEKFPEPNKTATAAKPTKTADLKPGHPEYETARNAILDGYGIGTRFSDAYGGMVDLSQVYGQAKRADPTLTPEKFRHMVTDMDGKDGVELHVRNEVRDLSDQQRALMPERGDKTMGFLYIRGAEKGDVSKLKREKSPTYRQKSKDASGHEHSSTVSGNPANNLPK